MSDLGPAFAPIDCDAAIDPPLAREPDEWRPLLPVPADAPKPDFTARHLCPVGYTFGSRWKYPDAQGHLLGYVARYNGSADKKQFRPVTFCEGPDGRREWRPKGFPDPRPLYGLQGLALRSDAPVLVVEGEKAADAASTFCRGYVATTSPSGANAARKADWSPLAGRDVVVWPDHDEPGAAYARDVAVEVQRAGAASVRVVAVPPTFPKGWDLADQRPPGFTDDDLAHLLEHAELPSIVPTVEEPISAPVAFSATDDPWRSPDLSLLGTGRRPAPAFPVDLLGPFWGDWATRKADAASSPVDYVGVSLLASVGAALGNVRWPLAGSSWSEPPVLWCGLVGSPSSGKSPSMDAAFELVRHAEERMGAGYDDERRRYETEKQAAEARRETWKIEVKNASKAGGSPPTLPRDAEEPEAPVRPRIRVADATTEKLGALAAANPRGLLLVRDELSGWLGGFDRYGGGGSDRAFALEAYGGRSYVVDRMKSQEPLSIRHLSIGVLGGVQPDKLSLILDQPDDGLASRVLWSWPDVAPGFSLARHAASDRDAEAAFARLTTLAMGSDEFANPEPKRIRLAEAAEDELEAYAKEVATRVTDATGIFAGALGKARGHVLRLALVFEHLWWSPAHDVLEPSIITGRAVRAAAGLVDGYFLPMAERVCGDAAIPAGERQAMAVAHHLRRAGLSEFNARVVRREIGGLLREAAVMDAACAVLVDAGRIRPLKPSHVGAGRRPKNFEVNSAVLGRPS
jgi:hypothetical protein